MFTRSVLIIALSGMSQVTLAADMMFSDQTAAAGLLLIHDASIDHRSGPMVGGGAIGDFNLDGFPALFITGGGDVADALFMNNGDGPFTDRADAWGIALAHRGMAATVADFDDDGDDDIYVTSQGPMTVQGGPGMHLLYRNDGGYFVDIAEAAGVAETASYPDGYGASFGDYDRDGDLDLFVGGWHSRPALGARLFVPNRHLLLPLSTAQQPAQPRKRAYR